MKIITKQSGTTLFCTIEGHITGISEAMQIKTEISSNENISVIELNIPDAYVIPSMLIGYLVKTVAKDKKSISIKCGTRELKQLIIDLNLQSVVTLK